jgi:hypothetical protein
MTNYRNGNTSRFAAPTTLVIFFSLMSQFPYKEYLIHALFLF